MTTVCFTTPVAFLTVVYYNHYKRNINRQFDFFCQFSYIFPTFVGYLTLKEQCVFAHTVDKSVLCTPSQKQRFYEGGYYGNRPQDKIHENSDPSGAL